MSEGKQLENKICLVSGTSRGIGKAIAENFAKEGAVVYATARDRGSIDDWAAECSRKYKTSVIPLYFDICDGAEAKSAIMKIKKEQNRIDILVNNAGIVSYEMIGMIDFEKLRSMLEVNVVAVINLIQLISRVMSRQKSGSIINISSIVGVEGVSGQLAYSASKGAINALTKSAAKELSHKNIRVNAIAPGMIGTDRLKAVMEEKFKERISAIGMGRLGSPEDIANACVFLGSDKSEYITGQILGVDGSTIL